MVLQDLPLSLVDIAETDVDQSIALEERLAPSKLGNLFLGASLESEEERDGAAVDVTRLGRERSVDVLRRAVVSSS